MVQVIQVEAYDVLLCSNCLEHKSGTFIITNRLNVCEKCLKFMDRELQVHKLMKD